MSGQAGDEVRSTDRDAELDAMRQIDIIVAGLPRESGARGRVLRWACDRFGVTVPAAGEGEWGG